MADKRALKILFDAHWTSSGWKDDRAVPAPDREYAVAAGVMFEPLLLPHDQAVARAIRAVERTSRDEVVAAFVSSLTSRRLEHRSALGSYAVGRHLPRHDLHNRGPCAVCGGYQNADSAHDLNVLSFERFMWGGVRHDQPVYIGFDLERFVIEEKAGAGADDYAILRATLEAVKAVPADARARDAEKAIAPVMRSNKSEREMLIDILGYCGVLQPRDRPGFLSGFVNASDRATPPVSKIDWKYPVSWWRGSDGINDAAVRFWFPGLG